LRPSLHAHFIGNNANFLSHEPGCGVNHPVTMDRPLTPPRAAAFAGLLFSLLMIGSLGIIRLALPSTPGEQRAVNPAFGNAIPVALHMVPFAGLAFLWFLGVLRDRIGPAEDRFFATVFLGSGLLFVACLFASAAVAGAVLGGTHPPSIGSEVYDFARQVCYAFLNIFGIKMAGVFTFSTCIIAWRTATFPRWIVFSGFVCALVLLLVISHWLWIAMLFPLWTILISVYILTAKREPHD
jgi:hypothetical protein